VPLGSAISDGKTVATVEYYLK